MLATKGILESLPTVLHPIHRPTPIPLTDSCAKINLNYIHSIEIINIQQIFNFHHFHLF